MNIVGISGSLRPGSVTKQLVETVLDACQGKGINTQLLDLSQYQLPFCNGTDNYTSSEKKTIQDLRQTLDNADGFIIGTPEYHGGYSGVLKNFLDHMNIDQFRGKLVALVGAAGGRIGADGSLNQLRVVFKNLEALCYPIQTTVGGSDVQNGIIQTPAAITRLKEMGEGFTKMLKSLNS